MNPHQIGKEIKSVARRIRPGFSNAFNNGLDEEVEGMLVRFADIRKLDGITKIDRNNIQNNLDNLEKHAKSNRK